MRLTRCCILVAVAGGAACVDTAHRCDCPNASQQDPTPVATPNPLNFGDVPIGGSVSKSLTLVDLGNLPLDLESVTIDGGAGQFAFGPLTNLKNPFSSAVQSGGDAGVTLVFKPTLAGGPATADLVINSNSNETPVYNVTLLGNGVYVSIVASPASLDFGPVQVSTQSTLPVTLTNQGTFTSSAIIVAAVTGTQAADFNWTGTPILLGPNQSFTLQVTFAPTQQGLVSALIPFQACTSCTPQNIELIGTGVDCQLAYDPNAIAFSGVPVGTSVSSGTVTLTNVGSTGCQINSLALDSPSSVYALGGVAPTPITLQVNGSTTFSVTYTAASSSDPPDNVDATFVPLDQTGRPAAGISPRIVQDPITGSGVPSPCSLTIVPPALAFGNVTVGTTASKSVTITNIGQQQCAFDNVALSATTDPSFSLAAGTPAAFTLNGGQSQSLTVNCDVATNGTPVSRQGALTFVSLDTTPSNLSVPLTATVQ